MAGLTQKAYAARKKVTPQYVSKLVRQGRIPLGRDGLINPKQADVALAQSSKIPWRSKIRHPRGDHAKARSSKASMHPARGKPKLEPVQAPPRVTANSTLTSARAANEGYKARLAKLEYEKAVGSLLPKDEVLEAERRKNANIRTRFRRIARALAPRLARAKSPAEMEAIMLEEIDAQLQELAADPLGQKEAPQGDVAARAIEAPVPSVQTFAEGARA